MNIAIVGYGYWGKIVEKTLLSLGYRNINKYDIQDSIESVYEENVFICTPAVTHFNLCQFFLKKKKNVFCEKPPCLSYGEAELLFKTAQENNAYFFVDWIFTFNNHVNFIKNFIKSHEFPRKIILNKLNFGPIRYDVSAKIDLAIHDISLLIYLFGQKPENVSCFNYKLNPNSKQTDSFWGIFSVENCRILINSSWEYPTKEKVGLFDFGDSLLIWDDVLKIIKINNQEAALSSSTPLENSINAFFKQQISYNQKQLTLDVMSVITTL